MTPHVLLLSTTTGYQTRAFAEAADRAGVRVTLATDRCKTLDDPWRDAAIPVRFHDETGSLRAIVQHDRRDPFSGVLALGDRPVVLAARVAERLGLPGHPPAAALASRHKGTFKACLGDAGLPVPRSALVPIGWDPSGELAGLGWPRVVKPLVLSGSRGVIRADDQRAFETAFARVRRLLESRAVRALRDPDTRAILIEEYIPGDEHAIEGLVERGRVAPLTIFDKPDPLVGPFFEETIYVTPSRAAGTRQERIVQAVQAAVTAIGLRAGPIHAECRVEGDSVFVLEVAARPIGGLCARALRFEGAQGPLTFEELLLRHAAGERVAPVRESLASGVMMIPIPRAGVFRSVSGQDAARGVAGVDDLVITAKRDQVLVPLPEGASYLGFIFARGTDAASVEASLRAAHRALRFTVDVPLQVVDAPDVVAAAAR